MVTAVVEGEKGEALDMAGIVPRVKQLLARAGAGDIDVSGLRVDLTAAVVGAAAPVLARKMKDDRVRSECLRAQGKAIPHLDAVRGKKMFVQLAGADPLVFEFRLARPFLLYLAFLVRAGLFLDGLPFFSRAFAWSVDRLFGPEDEDTAGPGSPSAGRSMAARLAASNLAIRTATALIAKVSRCSEVVVRQEMIPGFWVDPEWLIDLLEDDLTYRRGPHLMQKGVVFAMSAIEQGNSFRMKGLAQFVAWFGGWHEMWEFLANGALIPMFVVFTVDTYRRLGERLPRFLDPVLKKYGC